MSLLTQSFMISLQRGRAQWNLLVVALLFGSVLTWLYMQANAITPQRHFDYARALRELRQGDAEINLEVFGNRLEVIRNYDHLAHAVLHTEQIANSLLDLPTFLSEDERQDLTQRIRAVQRALHTKAERVDAFKRENASLRNSLSYFPLATDRLMNAMHLPYASKTAVEHYARHLLSFARDASPEREGQVVEAKQKLLLALAQNSVGRADILNLLLHGDLIISQLPLMNHDMHAIKVALPGAQLDGLNAAYVQAYRHADRRAGAYRRVLFLLALFLSAYLAYTLFRLAHGRQSLLRAHNEISRRYAAQLLAESRLRLHATAFQNSHDGILLTDVHGNILDVNPAFTRITGYERSEVLGHNPRLLKSDRHELPFFQHMWACLQEQGNWQGEIWNRNKQGDIYPELLSIAAVRNTQGEVESYVAVFTDIRRLKDQEAQLTRIAYHDALTGLPNRLLLTDRLEQAVAHTQRSGSRLAVCYLDLDGFKPVNDRYGHQVGDLLLVEVARRLSMCVRATDTVARLGGDEFLVLLQGLNNGDECEQAVLRILQAINEPIAINGLHLSVSVSVGVAWYPQDDVGADMLIRHADQAMYRAKQSGKNCYYLFDPEHDVPV